MHRIFGILALYLLFSSQALAGNYDGVWVFEGIDDLDFFIVNQNAGTLLMVGVNKDMDGWDAFVGVISDSNTVEMDTLLSQDAEQIELTATFTSPTTGNIEIRSCLICDTGFPLNVPLPWIKIF